MTDHEAPHRPSSERGAPPAGDAAVGNLVHHITDDLKAIAHDEMGLVRIELSQAARRTAADAVVIALAGLVALIGLGLLCVALVAALAPIMTLWVRLVVVAAVYMALGGGLAYAVSSHLRRDATPNLSVPRREVRRTLELVRDQVRHG